MKAQMSTQKNMKKYDSTSRVTTFQTTWTNDRPWLRHDHTANKMYCDVCIKFGVANKNYNYNYIVFCHTMPYIILISTHTIMLHYRVR